MNYIFAFDLLAGFCVSLSSDEDTFGIDLLLVTFFGTLFPSDEDTLVIGFRVLFSTAVNSSVVFVL